MSLRAIKDLISTLSHDERKELLEVLVDSFVQPGDQPVTAKNRSLRELRGLGKEIWRGIDA